jgi:hypothetical protein
LSMMTSHCVISFLSCGWRTDHPPGEHRFEIKAVYLGHNDVKTEISNMTQIWKNARTLAVNTPSYASCQQRFSNVSIWYERFLLRVPTNVNGTSSINKLVTYLELPHK